MLNKGAKAMQQRKENFFQQMALNNWTYMCPKNNNLDTKNQLKMGNKPKCEMQTIKS